MVFLDTFCKAVKARIEAGHAAGSFNIPEVYEGQPAPAFINRPPYGKAVVRIDDGEEYLDQSADTQASSVWRVRGSVYLYVQEVNSEWRMVDCRLLIDAVRAWLRADRKLSGAALDFKAKGFMSGSEAFSKEGVVAHGIVMFEALLTETYTRV